MAMMELTRNGFQIRSLCNAIDENPTRKLTRLIEGATVDNRNSCADGNSL
jgi:hypothetical protein